MNETRKLPNSYLMGQKVVEFSLREKKEVVALCFSESMLTDIFQFVLSLCFLSAEYSIYLECSSWPQNGQSSLT